MSFDAYAYFMGLGDSAGPVSLCSCRHLAGVDRWQMR